MKQYIYSFVRPDYSIARYCISATGKSDALAGAIRVHKQLEKYWMGKTITLGDPLPDWFTKAMSKGLIVTSEGEYNGPFDPNMSKLCAFVWSGKEIQVAKVGDEIDDNSNGTYTVWKNQ